MRHAMNELALITKLRRRDPDALFYLYNEYRDRVFAVVRRIVRDDWDAEEVVQDVFWTVHRKIDLFREDSALWSWMYRISVNAAKMKVRKYKRFPIPMEDDILKDIHSSNDGGDDTIPAPDDKLASKQLIETMEHFLSNISDINRQLYVDMEINGLSKEDVAQKLDLTVPAVKTRLHRVRAGIRDHINSMYNPTQYARVTTH